MAHPLFAPDHQGLKTDFYQLVLSAVYHADGMWGEATFDLYARDMPSAWGYLVASGVEQAIESVLGLGFSGEEIDWLQQQPIFAEASTAWWESLRHLRFSGDVYGMPEGSIAFPGEPLLRVTAPLSQAGLLETRLIQVISHATGVATRASRIVDAAGGRRVYDFGARRMPGAQAALTAARAACVGGCVGTTYSLAGALYDLPTMGTLSEGYLAAYDNDVAALEAFRLHFPNVGYVTLPDGDLQDGVRKLAMQKDSIRIVRIDHWDLTSAGHMVREGLDALGMDRVKIMGSGSLTEEKVAQLAEKQAPIDLLAVGRHISQGSEGSTPSLAYRIAEIWRGASWEPVTRAGASDYPGRKQVVRGPTGDMICLEDEASGLETQGGKVMLEPLILQGRRVRPSESVQESAARCREQLDELSDAVRSLTKPEHYPVTYSDGLSAAALR